MKPIATLGLTAGLSLLVACVTINIYFPAAEAEQAAEKIVEDIIRAGEPGEDKGTDLGPAPSRRAVWNPVHFLVPPAHAAEPDFNVDTPRVRRIQAGMKQRFPRLKPHFDNGGIGFTRDALVAVRDPAAISLRDRNPVNRLLADENRDRDALYRAIAEANGRPEWEPDIRATFARTWVDKAEAGWWYQDQRGAWRQK